MNTNTSPGKASATTVETPNEVSLLDIVNAGLRSWRLLVLLPLVLAVLAGGYALLQTRTYSASASFVPQTADAARASVTGLARQFGVTLGSEQSGQSPEFYAMLLTTRDLLRELVEGTYAVNDATGGRRGNLIELYEVDLPDADARMQAAIRRLRNDMTVTTLRSSGGIQFSVSAPWPSLAEDLATRILALVNEFNLRTRQARASAEAAFASARLQEAHRELVDSETSLKEFLQRNRQFQQSPELLFEHARLERQVAIRHEVYVALVQAHEQARIASVRDLPVITVLERPEGAAIANPRRTVIRAALGFVLGAILAFGIALTREAGRRLRSHNAPEYVEFAALRKQVIEEVRKPRQWLGVRASSGASKGT